MNDASKSSENLPAIQQANATLRAAEEDAGFERLLKFKKGAYESDNAVVPWGTEYIAHCEGWMKVWIKFVDKKVVDRKIYLVEDGIRPPDRETLDDLHLKGSKDPKTGLSADPWVYQHILPLEDKAGEIIVFVTSSTGGKRAVADLCKSWARRKIRMNGVGDNPVIKLSGTIMPTQHFGDVQRPAFEIVGWDGTREGVRLTNPPDTLKDEMNDEIPF